MKLKHILAGVLTAAMVISSVPMAGMNASAAEYTQITTITEGTVRANSEQIPAKGNDGPATWAFDDEDHWWHSRYSEDAQEGEVTSGVVSETNPIWIEAGFNDQKKVARLMYRSREDERYGRINKYEILAADMGTSSEQPDDTDFVVVKSGNLNNPEGTSDVQNIDFPAVQATHIRLKVYSVYGNGGTLHVAAKKIELYEDSSATNPAQIKDISASVKEGCESMGTATASASKMAEGISTVTLTATPADINHNFVRWTDAEGNQVSTDAVYTTSTAGAYTAEFAEERVAVTQLTVENTNSNSWMGGMGASNAFVNTDDTHWSGNTGDTNTSTGNMSGIPSDTNKVYIQGGFGSVKNLKKLTYKVSSTSAEHCIKDYEILVANSSETNPLPSEFVKVMEGTLAQTTGDQVITLPYPVAATHFRLQATSSYGNSYVIATYIAAYEQNDASEEVKSIVSLTDKARVADEGSGSVSMTPSIGISGEDTQVTLTATAAEEHYFLKWTDENGDTVGRTSSIQVTVNSTGAKVYTANFVVGSDPYYEATRYWDKEKAAGTLGTQIDADIWHYQIESGDTWVDLPSPAYNDSHPVNTELGAWCEGNDGSDSGISWSTNDKISRTQITPFSAKMGLLWKAFGKGYYSVALEEGIGEVGSATFSLKISHVKGAAVTVLKDTFSMNQGDNFTTRIVKMDVGESIRIATGDFGINRWATNFKPMIVPKTAKEYATQYLADLATEHDDLDTYTTTTVTAYGTAKSNLESAIAEGAQDTEKQITEKIEALETAEAALTKKPRIENTSVSLGGKIGLTFYTDLTSKDGVTASFTVDGTKVEAAPEMINNVVAYTYESAAKNMTDNVSLTITVNGDTITSPATSVSENAQWLLENSEDDKLKALLKAMLNYGAAAQKQFGYKADDESKLANAVLTGPTDKDVPEIDEELKNDCNTMGVTAEGYRGISLVLKSGTAMKLYVAGKASIVLKKYGTQVVAATSAEELNNGFSFVALENIAANHLQDEYTVEIDNGEAGRVSPLYYCYLVSKEPNPAPNLKNLVNALYDYNKKAVAYESAQSQP